MKYMKQSITIMFEEDHFAKNVQSIGMIRHEALLILKILPTKPQIKTKIVRKL